MTTAAAILAQIDAIADEMSRTDDKAARDALRARRRFLEAARYDAETGKPQFANVKN